MAAPRTIRAADDAAYPPQIMLNDKGEAEGLEADLIRALERETGFQVELSLGSWDDAVQKLRKGSVDIIPGMNVTEERKREFGFTRPYFEDRVVLFVPIDSFHIVELYDLKDRRVGVQKGEVAEQLLKKKLPELNYYHFNSQRELLQAVAERKVDAVAAIIRVSIGCGGPCWKNRLKPMARVCLLILSRLRYAKMIQSCWLVSIRP